MGDDHLIEYIHECIKRGFSEEEIYTYMLSRGYSQQVVNAAFIEAGYQPPQPVQPMYELSHEDQKTTDFEYQTPYYTPLSQEERPDETFYEHVTHLANEPAHDPYWEKPPQPLPRITIEPQPVYTQPEVVQPLPPSRQLPSGHEKEPSPKTYTTLLIIQIILLIIILVVGTIIAFIYYPYT